MVSSHVRCFSLWLLQGSCDMDKPWWCSDSPGRRRPGFVRGVRLLSTAAGYMVLSRWGWELCPKSVGFLLQLENLGQACLPSPPSTEAQESSLGPTLEPGGKALRPPPWSCRCLLSPASCHWPQRPQTSMTSQKALS